MVCKCVDEHVSCQFKKSDVFSLHLCTALQLFCFGLLSCDAGEFIDLLNNRSSVITKKKEWEMSKENFLSGNFDIFVFKLSECAQITGLSEDAYYLTCHGKKMLQE